MNGPSRCRSNRGPDRSGPLAFLLAVAGVLIAAGTSGAAEPVFDDAFWKHWGDGKGELCAYDLVFPRYGQARSGSAVTIFVTETFSHEARVKADPGVHPPEDEYPVMKLNLVQDFATGIYDYQLMTSAFWGITRRDGRPAGSPAKVTFSAQEWCGQVFHELLPDAKRIRFASYSYFDGEGDRQGELDYPKDALFEDGLFHWARGFASPRLDPGEEHTVKLLRSVETVRLRHVPLEWEQAELRRSRATESVEVPAGTFDVDTFSADVAGEHARSWTFRVEAAPPHRIVSWAASDGRRAVLVGSDRIAYWKLNAPGYEKELERIGLSPRPPRTP